MPNSNYVQVVNLDIYNSKFRYIYKSIQSKINMKQKIRGKEINKYKKGKNRKNKICS